MVREEIGDLLSKRYIQDEFNYIWDCCKKYDFVKYIKNDDDAKWLKQLIIHYGFVNVQQCLRKIHKWKLTYPLNTLSQELYKMTVDKDELMAIPAYRDAVISQYNEKINKEMNDFYVKQIEEFDKKYSSFNNFDSRNRDEGNSEGYLTYEEIENRLLGWDK
ncbi:hypothetical protein [Clostridium celatum]|uniref:Uncharacterized protein n=1 Tax=Clostridium celatum DSM 1785 TaxID=545697 RepID=L1QG74_9CLOT|nr:hypothetical protein [Clostridium celatum]EKY26592.1 hypothetical protein HMPREF0216_01777 [Clostridium celatum DSM 1785]